MNERAKIVAYIRADADDLDRCYQAARLRNDQSSMDRIAARSRTARRLADEIERGEHDH